MSQDPVNQPTGAFKQWVREVLDRTRVTSVLRQYVKELRGAHWAFFHGNYGTPIPNRAEVAAYLNRTAQCTTLPGVDLRKEGQLALLQRYKSYYQEVPFPTEPDSRFRYHLESTCFGYADGIFLYSFLRHFQPRRIIEVGTGWSSAVSLDTLEHLDDRDVRLTFVEPWPDNLERLKARLKPAELARATILAQKVQEVDSSVFSSLQAGDLLFIASSHFVKCGSDVQRLLFEILPALPVGVFVQFHGVYFPFEYPAAWFAQGRFLNECYFLRAFLSYNDSWEIVFFNDYVNREFEAYLRDHMPLCLKRPGSSIYLRRVK